MTTSTGSTPRRFRSSDWFDDPERIDQTALYLERFMNYGITPEELRAGRPIIGIAQTGSDLNPCNRIHLELARRVRDGAPGPRRDPRCRRHRPRVPGVLDLRELSPPHGRARS